MRLSIPNSADAAYEADQRRFEVEPPDDPEPTCEACGDAPRVIELDCLPCAIEGDLEWIQRERAEAVIDRCQPSLNFVEWIINLELGAWIWYEDNLYWLKWVGFFALFILVAFCMIAVGVLTPDTSY